MNDIIKFLYINFLIPKDARKGLAYVDTCLGCFGYGGNVYERGERFWIKYRTSNDKPHVIIGERTAE